MVPTLRVDIRQKELGQALSAKHIVRACPFCGQPGVLHQDKHTKKRHIVEWAHVFQIVLNLKNEPELAWGSICDEASGKVGKK